MARNCVPVYSIHGHKITHITLAEAEKRIELGSAKRVSRLKAPLKIQLTSLERLDQFSPCSISYSEVLANAGVPPDGLGSTLSQSRIQQVREKVANWKPSWADRIVTA